MCNHNIISNEEQKALENEAKDRAKLRESGYCPHCKTVHTLKLYTQTYPAKYNKPDKHYADCTDCGNTFAYPATAPY